MTLLINQLIDLRQPSLYVALGSIVWVSEPAGFGCEAVGEGLVGWARSRITRRVTRRG